MAFDDDEEMFFFMVCLCYLSLILLKRKRFARQFYARPINRLRIQKGEFRNLFREIKGSDEEQFYIYTRMSRAQYDYLFTLVKPFLRKRKTINTLLPEERFAMTLRFLSQGENLQTIAWAYRCGKSTARIIVHETCSVIWNVLKSRYVKEPTLDDFLKYEKGFRLIWNMPNCIGALDGKHIHIKAPGNSGSEYFNYKKTNSLVLMASCDALYRFTMISVGEAGGENDAGVFSRTNFGQGIADGKITASRYLPNSETLFPLYFVGDEGFPLLPNLMRPFPGNNSNNLEEEKQIFNYRLSRARRTIENTFGILCTRWRILLKIIWAEPAAAEKIVLATICLHNFLMHDLEQRKERYCPDNYADKLLPNGDIQEGQWRQDAQIDKCFFQNEGRPKNQSIKLRDILKNYLNNQGIVPWQNNIVRRGRIGFLNT